MKKILNNVMYQAIYQLLQVILPIITVPIVSGALGPKGLGIYNFTTSIVNYFVLFAGLGLSNYGVREIARCRSNKKLMSQKFFELEGMSVLLSIIIFVVYVLFIFFAKYREFYLIEIFLVIGAVLDISWFYIGIEEFGKVSLANMIIKIVAFVLIVLLVHDYSDTKLYVLIQSMSTFLSQGVLWLFLKNRITYVHVSIKEMLTQIKPATHYFISKIAISLYTTLNKTLLGILGTVTAVGYFSNAVTLCTMLVTIMTSIDEALLPRMSNLVGNGDEKKAIKIMEKAVHLSLWITIPAMFGLISISGKLVGWFYGGKFEILKILLPMVAPLMVIMPLGISIARQYLVPKGNIRGYNISVLAAGIVSIIINVVAIPRIGVYGAIIATLTSESLNTIIRVVELLKKTSFSFDFSLIVKYVLMSFIMSIVIYESTLKCPSSAITTLMQTLIGIVIYGGLSLLLKLPFKIIKNNHNYPSNK